MIGRDPNRRPRGKQACYPLSYATLLIIRLGPASAFFFILVPDWLDAGQSGIPAFSKKLYKGGKGTLHPARLHYSADDGEGYTLHVYLSLLYDVDKSYINAGMPRKS